MTTTMTLVVTGAGVRLPGVAGAQELAAQQRRPASPGGPPDTSPPSQVSTAPPVSPADLVGRKGLRYKDRATQLGYCLAADALRDAGLLSDDNKTLTVPARSVGVVASSNFGNLDTVCRALDTIREETSTSSSPMDLPNASSNVIASSVAIRFGLRGPNLMVCNGETSGLDAVRWAATLLAAGRAERILVLGVEPDNDVVRRLLDGRRAVDGGAAIVVEDSSAAAERSAPVRAVLGGSVHAPDLRQCLDRLDHLRDCGPTAPTPALWQVPDSQDTTLPDDLLPGIPRAALDDHAGRAAGALGVLHCAAAVGYFENGGTGPVYAVAGGGTGDPSAGLMLLAPTPGVR